MREEARELVRSLAQALGPGRGEPQGGVGPPPFWVSRPDRDHAPRFLQVFEALGGHGRVLSTREEARAGLRQILAEAGARTAVRWRDPFLDDLIGPAGASLEAFGCQIEAVDGREVRRARLARTAEADAGIVVADLAVASTGTLVHRSGGDRLKSVSLLPPVLIVCVDRSRVVDIFSAAVPEIRGWLEAPGECQGYQMISGPSRSSDIENDLTIGVHGPGRVYALVIGEAPGPGGRGGTQA